jgi:hypothetical protein
MAEDSGSGSASKDNAKKISDAWIFVSHSHHDLDSVRRVRDEFERLHANPLLFFLLALKDDDEVNSLIKREITERNFFLLCDSPSARASKWVQNEREFVRSLKDRKIHELDLDWPWERQRRVIRQTLQSATTFISYSHRDGDRVRPYIDLLVANDFAVFEPTMMSPGGSWIDQLETAISQSVMGYFFAFLSHESVHSRMVRAEIEHFVQLTKGMTLGRLPFLVALDPLPSVMAFLPAALQKIQILDFSGGNVAENEQKLLEAVDLRQRSETI